jgi:hypothetical protein
MPVGGFREAPCIGSILSRLRFIWLKRPVLRIGLLHVYPVIYGDKEKEKTKCESDGPIPYREPHPSEPDSGHNEPGDCG